MASAALLSAARGDTPADLLLCNARIVNVFSGEIETGDIAIVGDRIAGIGSGYTATQTVDLAGAFVAPGLIDAHVHIESSLCLPPQFAAAVVPHGVTTAVTDPHEIANVAGAAGVRFMASASKGLPLRVVTMAPSCVPATDMATTGAKLDLDDLNALLRDGVVHGLAEVMNFPGVITRDASVAAKLEAFAQRPIDGHAPGVLGKALNTYVAAGVGSDHECVSASEAKEKLARGAYVLIREATNARNLDALLPMITPANCRRIGFCTDDRQPADLLKDGSIDEMLRRAIAAGLDPIDAIRCCTLNTAEWFGLRDRGAIAPGRLADLIIFGNLRDPLIERVYSSGRLAAQEGRLISPLPQLDIPSPLTSTCRVSIAPGAFTIAARGGRVRVIGSLRDQLITEHRILDAANFDGQVVADASRDLLKMAVIDRHGGGGIGLGFIQGIGLRRGAMAGTVAHDHHNLVVIGGDDGSMTTAARAVAGMGGGLAVAAGENVLAQLALPVAGLMSDRPVQEVAVGFTALLNAARELGSPLHDPFTAMSFMALEVIPSLKLTDQGLVDVDAFRHVDLFV